LKELAVVIAGTEQNSKEILLFNVSYSVCSFFAAIAFAVIFGGFRAAMLGLFVGLTLPAALSFYRKLRKHGFSHPNRSLLRKSLSYGGPLMVVTTVNTALSFFASYFVSAYVGLDDVAVLGVALTVSSIVGFIVMAPLPAYNAYLVNSYESGQFKRSNVVTTRVIEIFISSVTVIFVLVLSAGPLIISIVATEAYLDAVSLIPYTTLSVILFALSSFWRYRLLLKEKTQLVGLVYLISLGMLVISANYLVQNQGTGGVGIALIIQAAFVLITIVILAQRNLSISISRVFFGKWFLGAFVLIMTFGILSSLSVP
jgi:O-antigen/teichoic acid export membrane protein